MGDVNVAQNCVFATCVEPKVVLTKSPFHRPEILTVESSFEYPCF
jgi:hypothetical protein